MKALFTLSLLLLPLVSSCTQSSTRITRKPAAQSTIDPFASLSAECQSEVDSGVLPIKKQSDVRGSSHYLKDRPSTSGNRKINQKATRALGETMYVSIDYSTRVFVECYLPSTKFAYVRVQEPSYLREHRGWVPSSVLSLNLGSTQKASKSKTKSHIVVYDTRDKYQEAPVDFIQTSSAVCGSGGRRGVRGAGVVKFFSPPETLTVEIIPCAEGGLTYVKLPDGRVLHLRKSI